MLKRKSKSTARPYLSTNWLKMKKGRDFVDLMWSCARNAPADWTVFEGKGCHSQYTSKLEEGLVYKDQKQVYGELVKWQNPVKEGYKEIRGATERINKLLEVTRLDRDQRTQVPLCGFGHTDCRHDRKKTVPGVPTLITI